MTEDVAGASDKVAVWEVPLNSGLYIVEFDHGTTSGKRIVRVNGKVRNWLICHHLQTVHNRNSISLGSYKEGLDV